MRNPPHHSLMPDAAIATHDVVEEVVSLPSVLLASVSHDLRNPLSVVLGASEMLQQGIAHLVDDDHRAYLHAIRRECVRMDEYIQGLLHATRLLLGGSARLVRDWIGIDELLGAAVERLRRYREGAHVAIHAAPALQPVHVNGALVEQALLNVLDNAVKFSPPEAAVQVRVAQDAGDTRIDVLDAGCGIAPGDHERVFGLFVSDDPQARGRAGSGLGLAISRGILRAHGGDVVAQAVEDGQGTRVVLTLPTQEAMTGGAR